MHTVNGKDMLKLLWYGPIFQYMYQACLVQQFYNVPQCATISQCGTTLQCSTLFLTMFKGQWTQICISTTCPLF